jgi:hypothetical protein
MNRRQLLALAAATLYGLPARAAAPEFDVPDSRQRRRRLSEFKGKTVVLEWTSASCPFVRAQYESGVMPELQKWAAGQGVAWLSVVSTHPSRRDYLPAAKFDALHRGRGAAPAALLFDADGRMGRAYGAVVTPHMFIISPRGDVVYSGAISDNPTMSAAAARSSRNYVKAALEDLLAGRKIATASTRPFGCTIAYSGD